MGKRPQWNSNEDYELAKAWVAISEDPIKGNEQKNDTFWGNIYELWSLRTKCQRSAQALKNRWAIIHRSVQKFCGYYQKQVDLNASGANDDDKVSKAEELYATLEGHRFQYHQCWMVLRKCPKFGQLPTLGERISDNNGKRALEDVDDDGEDHKTPTKRPIGAKRAKAQSYGSSDPAALDRLAKAQEQKNDLFRDHMLMQMLLRDNSEQSQNLLRKLQQKLVKEALGPDSGETVLL